MLLVDKERRIAELLERIAEILFTLKFAIFVRNLLNRSCKCSLELFYTASGIIIRNTDNFVQFFILDGKNIIIAYSVTTIIISKKKKNTIYN